MGRRSVLFLTVLFLVATGAGAAMLPSEKMCRETKDPQQRLACWDQRAKSAEERDAIDLFAFWEASEAGEFCHLTRDWDRFKELLLSHGWTMTDVYRLIAVTPEADRLADEALASMKADRASYCTKAYRKYGPTGWPSGLLRFQIDP